MKVWRSGRVADCSPVGRRFAPAPPHAAFDTFLLCQTSSTFANNEFEMDVEKFVRHLCRLVLRHQMPVWNYFVNSFYSVSVINLYRSTYFLQQNRQVVLLQDVALRNVNVTKRNCY
jgi:hypothetical protein